MLGGVGEKFTINNSQFTIDFPATLNALKSSCTSQPFQSLTLPNRPLRPSATSPNLEEEFFFKTSLQPLTTLMPLTAINPPSGSFPPCGSDGAISLIKQKTRKKADAISPFLSRNRDLNPGPLHYE